MSSTRKTPEHRGSVNNMPEAAEAAEAAALRLQRLRQRLREAAAAAAAAEAAAAAAAACPGAFAASARLGAFRLALTDARRHGRASTRFDLASERRSAFHFLTREPDATARCRRTGECVPCNGDPALVASKRRGARADLMTGDPGTALRSITAKTFRSSRRISPSMCCRPMSCASIPRTGSSFFTASSIVRSRPQ